MAKNIFDAHEIDDENFGFCPQGSTYGIKSLGFRSSCPNAEADALGLNKDGFSCRGVPPWFRPVDNAKKSGRKALKKKDRKFRERLKNFIN